MCDEKDPIRISFVPIIKITQTPEADLIGVLDNSNPGMNGQGWGKSVARSE